MPFKLFLGLASSVILAGSALAAEPTEARFVLKCANVSSAKSMDTQWQKLTAATLRFQTNPSGSLNDYELEVKRSETSVEINGRRILGVSGDREGIRGVAAAQDGRYVGLGDIMPSKGRRAIGCDFTADFR